MTIWDIGNYLIGFIVLITGIILVIQDYSNSELYGKVKDKVSGVEVIDQRKQQQECNDNHVTRSDKDAVTFAIKSIYQGLKNYLISTENLSLREF